jgi:hypothetical protein
MFTDFSSFMNWLAGPGLPYFVGLVMSLIASRFPQWDKLPKEVKIVTPIALAVAFAFVVRLISIPSILQNGDLNFAFNVIIFYLSSQVQNDRNNKREADKLVLG